jgi:hypothetical protein
MGKVSQQDKLARPANYEAELVGYAHTVAPSMPSNHAKKASLEKSHFKT